MPQFMNRLALCVISIFPIFAAMPAYADEPSSPAVDDRAPRGLPCRRTCEDRYAEWSRKCDKMPEGPARNRCNTDASNMYKACLSYYQTGPRECIDDDGDDPMTSECVNPSPNEN